MSARRYKRSGLLWGIGLHVQQGKYELYSMVCGHACNARSGQRRYKIKFCYNINEHLQRKESR